jgi:uncharacterized membrane protein YeaQ/YmgE (transglycosylase-associated protein family)
MCSEFLPEKLDAQPVFGSGRRRDLNEGFHNMITSVIGWMVFGLVAGAVARLLHPGDDRMGMTGTIILGILGSLVGGGIAYMLRLGISPYQPGGWIMSIVGAVALLWLGFLGANHNRIRPTNY